jgi:hypothetical protein
MYKRKTKTGVGKRPESFRILELRIIVILPCQASLIPQ